MVKDSLGLAAKNNLILLAKEADLRLKKYWDEEIANDFGFNETQRKMVREMLLHGKEHNLRSAKRLRASFVYYGFLLGKAGGYDESMWRAVEAVELVHTALLMHDDFMDRDLVRRGGQTTQVFFGKGDEHFGESMAVCLGDAVLCLGFERLLTCGFDSEKVNKVMKQLLRGITNTAFGQAYDASLAKLGEMTEEKVMSLHRSPEVLQILHDYSVDGGIAFQLQDDVLGVFGDEEKTGKSANSDLLQGKVTLLVTKVMERGTEKEKKDIMNVWGKIKVDEKDIELAKKAIKDSGAYQYSVDVARKYAEKAAETAKRLRGRGLDEKSIDYLEGIARYMVEREV
ncbi:MAG: hypothetical protein UW80_C0023G0004 [Microgenomates group bacterium GW2011_GWC1_44_9]|nr:MAG: hypothetical protein UW80_C0023G0004 [Microgenomates group bacterium GW2011_GWC1_44_9]